MTIYSNLNKPNSPHSHMRNAFIEMSEKECLDKKAELIKEIDDAKTTISCNKQEIDTIDWELSWR